MRIVLFVLATLLLASACQAQPPVRPRQLVIFGDSFSLGSKSAEPVPDGWPDQLGDLLGRTDEDWSIDNRAINGNGLVWQTRCFGAPAIDRLKFAAPALDRQALIVLMAGVNDLIQSRLRKGYSDCFEPGVLNAADIVAALSRLRTGKLAQRILLATIPPFGASEFHSAAAERDRQEINHWVEANWPSEDVIDLATMLASPADTVRLNPDFDSGDGLHPNEKGKAVIAAAVKERIE